jgi:bla regulator protein blaR1
MAGGAVDRALVDQTGINGGFDFSMELPDGVGPPLPPTFAASFDPTGTTFLDLVRQELGLKLESTKRPIQLLLIDHVEQPSEN